MGPTRTAVGVQFAALNFARLIRLKEDARRTRELARWRMHAAIYLF